MSYWWCDNCEKELCGKNVIFTGACDVCDICDYEVEKYKDGEGPLYNTVSEEDN